MCLCVAFVYSGSTDQQVYSITGQYDMVVEIRTRTEVSPRSRKVAAPFERGNVVLCFGYPPEQTWLESKELAWNTP